MNFTLRKNCPLCQNRIDNAKFLIYVVSEWARPEEKLEYVYCRRCGLVYEKYLPATRSALTDESYSIEDYKIRVKQKERFHRERIKWLLKNLNLQSDNGLKLIDIGTADGSFLKYMQDRGFRVLGVDPESRFSEYCKQLFGIDIIPKFLEEAPLEKDSFDVATVFGVFEHVYDPNKFLRSIYQALKPGGFLYMAIPTVFYVHSGSIARSHTCLYSKNTLSQALEANGFKVLNINEPGLGNVFYDRTEIFASKAAPAAGYRFNVRDSYFKVKAVLNCRILAGHFEWLLLVYPPLLKRRHPGIFRFIRNVHRFLRLMRIDNNG